MIDKIREAGFWGLLLLAFGPKQTGVVGAVQKAVRFPINLGIVWFFGSIILLFSSLWWVGLLLHVAWYFVIPRFAREMRSRIVGTA